MEDIFNPYREWLGWQQSRGPDYYELLAIDRAETDVARIALAAEQAMSKVRSFRPGPHAQVWSRLLDEIRAARDCLSNSEPRADYDAALARTDRFRSSTGDLAAPLTPALLPPLAGSTGPAPIYDRQHQAVSVPTPPERPTSNSEGFECTPLPGAIDELLPPGAEEGSTAEAEFASAEPDYGGMSVSSAPTAGAFATAKARRARRGLALAFVGSATVLILAAGIVVWRSSGPRAEQTTTAEAPDAEPAGPSAVQSDSSAVRPGSASTESPELESAPQPISITGTATGPNSSPTPPTGETSAEPTSDAPKSSISAEEKRAKVQLLVAALETAKAALAEQNFSLADEQLHRAASLAESPKHRAAVARLAEIAGYVRQFRDAVAAAVSSMQAAETFKVPSGTEVAFVEGFADKVTLHAQGQNQTYSFRDLPPALALAIADRKLSPRHPTSAVVKGAYLAVHKQNDSRVQEKAKAFWEDAQAGGAKTAHLMPFFSDNYADFLKDTDE